ncbi:MAG TPA: quinone-dependent dihydroorotate dehydrogenase [Gemmataceae bacterium]|nr:quinone-dependent dihydroorotate dehydrogenase [Gemmataceae bacterium]
MWPLIRPLLFSLDAERAHHLSMQIFAGAMRVGPLRRLTERLFRADDPRLHVRRFGIDFPTPVGLAAGFDKNAEYFDALSALGFGFIEVGTLTAQAQSGNPRPRLFRLPADRALLNRMGFNNKGSAAAAEALARRKELRPLFPVLGVNIGRSKVVSNEEAVGDYLTSFERLFPFGRYFVVNVSSPNTPGLRELQQRGPLTALLRALTEKNGELAARHGVEPRPILLKIAPDLGDDQITDIVEMTREMPIAGLVATNTTVSRDRLRTPARRVAALGPGGVSGAPLTERTRRFVLDLYRRTQGRLPIIGVGGIMSGEDAWQMIRAGASLVQVYTGFVYGGPGFVKSIHRHLLRRLAQSGKHSLDEVVGSALSEAAKREEWIM